MNFIKDISQQTNCVTTNPKLFKPDELVLLRLRNQWACTGNKGNAIRSRKKNRTNLSVTNT